MQQDPLLYNEDEQEWIGNRMKEITILKDRDDPPQPPKLESFSAWEKWHPQFLSYLSQKVGGHTIPLSWIIRDKANPPASDYDIKRYGSQTQRLIAFAHFEGPEFQADNKEVFKIIKRCYNWWKGMDLHHASRSKSQVQDSKKSTK